MAGLFREKDYTDDKERIKESKKYFNKAFKLISPLPFFGAEEIKFKREIPNSEENINRNKEALRYLDKALEFYCEGDKELTKNKIYALKALILMLLSKFEEAIEIYDIIIYSEKNDDKILLDAYQSKCNLLIKINRFDESILFCDETLKKFPNNPYIVAYKGKALYKLAKYEESLLTCNKALEIFDKASNAWCYKILSLEKLGRFEEALKCIEDFSNKEPGELYDLEEIKEKIENKIGS